MLLLSGLAWTLLAKGASALGMSAILVVGNVADAGMDRSTGQEAATGPGASLGSTRNLRLLPEVVLGPGTADFEDSLLPRLSQEDLPQIPSLGLRRFHNILEVGLTFGASQALEIRTEESGSPTWLRDLDPADVAGIESLTLRLSWEI